VVWGAEGRWREVREGILLLASFQLCMQQPAMQARHAAHAMSWGFRVREEGIEPGMGRRGSAGGAHVVTDRANAATVLRGRRASTPFML